MPEFTIFIDKSDFERDLIYTLVSDLSEISKDEELFSKHFILFIACDFSKYTVDELSSFAEKMLDEGAVTICTWGKDCEKMCDIFDEIIVDREIETKQEIPLIMTTWHPKDSLDEALWFALNVISPIDEYKVTCKSTLIAAVGNEDWNKLLRFRLSDIESFNEEIVNQ
jgi:hypothetical protein